MTRPKSVGGAGTGGAFKAQQAAKNAQRMAKNSTKLLREERDAASKAARERLVEKRRRRAENELKGAGYQVVRAG
jgi:hypothetical protein